MSNQISSGKSVPQDINVIIEIQQGSTPVKYEYDKETSMMSVDRFVPTPMIYPVNYGFIPQTLAGDGDPLDALVITPNPIISGSVIRVRPIGVMMMEDESGNDEKILCVPHSKLTKLYDNVSSSADLPELILQQIEHYFTHYKDLEKEKWVKMNGWKDKKHAEEIILAAVKAYK